MKNIPPLKFGKLGGIVPVVVVDDTTGEVLMQAFMNQEAWELTLREGDAYYYSRARARIWKKGEVSGHVQHVREILVDCDEDAVLLRVEQVGGAACHTGFRSCFHRRVGDRGVEVIGEPLFDPAEVYDPIPPSEAEGPEKP